MELKGKKVLLVGLGILGGGLSMAKYLLSKGAKLTVTDLRDRAALKSTVGSLPSSVKYTLGVHKEKDFEAADIIIFNPAVPFSSPWVKLAKKLKKAFYNDYTFFLENIKELNPDALIVGITGTRGKTTVSTWASHLIPGSILGGNIPEKNLLRIMSKKTDVFVLELSSFQLEYATAKVKAPDIAVLTNLYVDHLNRYQTFDKYRDVKFNIFKGQTSANVLILNKDEKITKEVLAQKPRAQIFYISQRALPKKDNGLYFDGDKICYQYQGKITIATTRKGLAPHEKNNLLCAMLIAHLVGVEGKEINRLIEDLPTPILRQQVILENRILKVVNDSAGTSPEATIAAIEKFKGPNTVLITGGTNKDLHFDKLAKKIIADVKPNNLFLLEGSGTDLLISELSKNKNFKDIVPYENLEDIVDIVSQEFIKGTVVFSPGCASFEKFKNEFDRGQKFNKLTKKYFS